MRYWRLAAALAVVIGAGVCLFASGWADGRVGAILARSIPRLYLIALALTSLGFVGVEAVLVWSRFRAARRWDGWGVEAAWSIVPAAILASLVAYHSGAWAAIMPQTTAPRISAAAAHPQQENIRNWTADSVGREPQP